MATTFRNETLVAASAALADLQELLAEADVNAHEAASVQMRDSWRALAQIYGGCIEQLVGAGADANYVDAVRLVIDVGED